MSMISLLCRWIEFGPIKRLGEFLVEMRRKRDVGGLKVAFSPRRLGKGESVAL